MYNIFDESEFNHSTQIISTQQPVTTNTFSSLSLSNPQTSTGMSFMNFRDLPLSHEQKDEGLIKSTYNDGGFGNTSLQANRDDEVPLLKSQAHSE